MFRVDFQVSRFDKDVEVHSTGAATGGSKSQDRLQNKYSARKSGASKNMGPFFLEKNNLEQRTHKSGASKNMGPLFFAGENNTL